MESRPSSQSEPTLALIPTGQSDLAIVCGSQSELTLESQPSSKSERVLLFWGAMPSLSPGAESGAPPDRPGPRNMITGLRRTDPRPPAAPAGPLGRRGVCECLAAARRRACNADISM
ncbi:unnamed protein product [Gadus morhua 'NCC']